MISAPLPQNEKSRLFALHRMRVLDTDREQTFDRITSLARSACDAPIALIALVDRDRQWFKSSDGVDLRESPRQHSFCAYTILDEKAFIVNDTAQDERFSDNPWVVGAPFVKAYCGVPIHAATGERVGALCAVDTVARSFDAKEVQQLHLLAELIEELLQKPSDILRSAYFDHVTGLPSSLLILDKVNLSITETNAAAAPETTPVAIMVLNLDSFRLLNHSLGHTTSNRLLRLVGQRIDDYCDELCVVGRAYGDQFLIIFEGRSQEALRLHARVILDAIGRPFQLDEHELILSASIGVSCYPHDGRSANELLTNAEIALSAAKDIGRNTILFYQSSPTLGAIKQLELYSDLRQALANNELELYFQPQFELASQRVVGVEALLRWNHPRLGLMAPGDFIELAETSGLIIDIGEWVILEACRVAQSWRVSGLDDFTIAVNVSAVQFRRGDLTEVVRKALQMTGLPAQFLELEVTESILVYDDEITFTIITDLKALGLKLSIDDFGTGYSNLSYLSRMPFDNVKIDQSFVRNMLTNDEDLIIVKTIIELARSLDLKIVAEGIETQQQKAMIETLGCPRGQGFLMARPANQMSVEKLIGIYNVEYQQPGQVPIYEGERAEEVCA